jgi:hypothetical protein
MKFTKQKCASLGWCQQCGGSGYNDNIHVHEQRWRDKCFRWFHQVDRRVSNMTNAPCLNSAITVDFGYLANNDSGLNKALRIFAIVYDLTIFTYKFIETTVSIDKSSHKLYHKPAEQILPWNSLEKESFHEPIKSQGN